MLGLDENGEKVLCALERRGGQASAGEQAEASPLSEPKRPGQRDEFHGDTAPKLYYRLHDVVQQLASSLPQLRLQLQGI